MFSWEAPPSTNIFTRDSWPSREDDVLEVEWRNKTLSERSAASRALWASSSRSDSLRVDDDDESLLLLLSSRLLSVVAVSLSSMMETSS